MTRGLYARNLASAEAIRSQLDDAGVPVLGIEEVDLLTEGASLVPKKAVLVRIAEGDIRAAVEVLERRAPQLLEWIEDLSSLSLGFKRHQEIAETPRPSEPNERLSAWETDPNAWGDDLFSDDEALAEAVLAWVGESSTPTAPQVGKAIERAIREGREDLVWPLCRILKPVVDDVFLRSRGAMLGGNPIFEAMKAHSPGTGQAIESLVELSWDPSNSTRRNFCLAAGQLASETFLPALVNLLDDPEEEVRYEAITALFGMVHEDLGYDSEAPIEERALAVARWREWLAKRMGGSA